MEETRKDLLQRVVGLAKSDIKGFEKKIDKLLKQSDIEPEQHVGKAQDFFNEIDNQIEWLLGQFHSMVNHENEGIKNAGIAHLVARAESILKGGE